MKQSVYCMNSFSRSFLASVLLHGGLFFGISSWMIQDSQWGVDAGEGGAAGAVPQEIEVSLIAPEPESSGEPEPVSEIVPMTADFNLPEVKIKVEEENRPEPFKELQRPKVSHTVSKPVSTASENSISEPRATGSGGARIANKADYDRNPPPAYPSDAKKRGEQGTVILIVEISDQGGVESVGIETSSGFKSLDRAAQTAVRRWRFQPAKIAGIGIASSVKVPVRFQLEKN